MDSSSSSQSSLAKPGRGRGLMLQGRTKKSTESGIGLSVGTGSQPTVTKSDDSRLSLSSLRDALTTTEGSQTANDTGNESMPTGSRAESCAADDVETPFADAVQEVKEPSSVSKQESSNISAFSNTNCLRFEESRDVERCRYSVEFQVEGYDLYPADKIKLFLQEAMKKKLTSGLVKTYCFLLPNTLYTAGRLTEDLMEIKTNIDSHSVVLRLSLITETIDMKEFFDVLLQKIAVMMPLPKDFIPLRLIPEQQRFERYPGRVIDVLIERETEKIIIRCSTTSTNSGTVRDIITDCMTYVTEKDLGGQFFHQLVYKCLKDLVVLADIEKTTMVVSDILWDVDVPNNVGRDRHFQQRGVKRGQRPRLVCKFLNQELTVHMEAENLNVQGSRRTGASHPAARGHTEGGADRVSQFLGQAVSGQQRQLALMRYMTTAEHSIISTELNHWGLKLVDTAVISNGVLLQTDQMLRLGNDGVAPVESRGWLNRLSDLLVHTPVRISHWVVVAQRGDENTVTSMVENLINDAPQLGIEIRAPRTCKYLQVDDAKAYVGALKTIQANEPNLQLAIVIMRASRDDIYREVKKWALTLQNRTVATQILIRDTARAIASRLDVSLSVITQINCKMGGDLWTLDGALTGTLVIGMSGYTGVSGESWVGVVASKNRLFSRWYSTAFKNTNELQPYMAKAMRKYKMENKGDMPHTTVVFRRQLSPMSQEETAALQEVCGSNTAMVVVSLLDAEELAEYINARIETRGTEGLKDLHKKLLYVPHRKGVPTDTLTFYVENNTANLGVETITKVVKQLKHMYFNVAGETPLPAPLLYAGKCAEFIADILEQPPEEKFEDTLYYL